ncbi:protein kinase domain-containing protein [Nocardia fluminea]|uniref:protein kinase domain-containing protein n=1 Tax=Nocardia fluminea TaxID=134984 RepID=UPI0037A2A9DB
MTGSDPHATQRDTSGSVVAELAAAGFDDAVEIGRGGFGTVFRCAQPSLDRVVAVKVLIADLDEDNRARFFREQRAAGRLIGHPNIVNVLHADITGQGRPFLVMPYYAGGSLDARLRDSGPLDLREALRLGVKMAGALETAHRFGVLHRDVKPANILFTAYGEPALADFGIAHFAGGFHTATGVVTGTPAFTAPEVIAGEPPGPAADVYGLGATLFAAITGHAAFERRSSEQLVAQFVRIASEPIPDLRDFSVPEDVGAVVERAMGADAGARPSAAELGAQLQESQRLHGFPVDEMALHTPTADDAGSHEPKALLHRRGPSKTPAGGDRRGTVPAELTSFVDRRTELTEATNALSSSRLVTLTGTGGVGKTRFAVRIAAGAKARFADGVAFVELGDVRDESLVVGIVAGALGLPDRSMRPVREMLVETLSDREFLIVLDNCEQVVAAVAELADSLLRACPGLRILATSREPIGVDGESLLPIRPLEVPDPDRLPRSLPQHDAVKLFADRAGATVAGFEITDENIVTIAKICRQLDGLPLPIELAAARLRAMSPDQILQRLTDRFGLLIRGSRSAPPRQQTLRMCIDWSHDLCTPAEQQVWAQLSVFAGGFDFDAARFVCGYGPEAAADLLDTLACLVDKSILVREEFGASVQFRMLGTVREYGHEKARTTGDYLELCRRHRDWYERLAQDAHAGWAGAQTIAWITRLHRDRSNLRQALEFCVSDSPAVGLRIAAGIWPFWFCQGALSEGRRWLDRLLTRRTGPLTVAEAAARYVACMMAAVQGDLPAAAVVVREGRTLAEQTTDPLIRAHIDFADGVLALYSGNAESARGYFGQAIEVYAPSGDALFHIDALTNLGLTYQPPDDTDRAIECYERALALAEGETIYRSYLLCALAVALWRQGDPARATDLIVESLQFSRTVDDRTNSSACLQVLAWIAAEQRDAERAVVLTAAAEQLGRSVGTDPVLIPDMTGHHEECERFTRQAMSERAYSAARREGAVLSFDAAIAYALRENKSLASTDPVGRKLTKREREVAFLVAEGLTNREIATRLVISPRTAQGHVEHLLAKLGFTSRAQIAAWTAAAQNATPGSGKPATAVSGREL